MKEKSFSAFRRRFLLLSAGALVGSLLFLYLDTLDLFDLFLICPFHVFGLYCPTCGMTRAAHALLSLDFLSALSLNPCLFILLFTALWYMGFGMLALIKRDAAVFSLSGRWPLWLLLFSLAFYFLLRNILLLFFHIDLLGDFF